MFLDTNCGLISIDLDVNDSPKTATAFAGLVNRGFFSGLTFHRIANQPDGTPFVIQGGDPLGDGLGGPGYRVIERPPPNTDYTRGVVAMAKSATEPAGTSGSQFFIVTGRDAGLPPEYALLGHVSAGMKVVDRISAAADAGQRDAGVTGRDPQRDGQRSLTSKSEGRQSELQDWRHARNRRRLPRPAPFRPAAAAPQSVGHRLGQDPRHARIHRAGHDQRRLRRVARSQSTAT